MVFLTGRGRSPANGSCLRGKHRFDLLELPWPETVGINAHIKAVPDRLVIEPAMHMSEEMPRAAPAAVPFAHRIVAEHDRHAVHADLPELPDRGKDAGVTFQRRTVVIAGDQMHFAVQLCQIVWRGARVAEAEIAEMVDGIARRDHGIPFLDQRRIHFLHRSERPPAELEHRCMAEMGVRSEIDSHGLTIARLRNCRADHRSRFGQNPIRPIRRAGRFRGPAYRRGR